MRKLIQVALCSILAAIAAPAVAEVPLVLVQQGQIVGYDTENASVLTVELIDAQLNVVYSQSFDNSVVVGGYYSVALGPEDSENRSLIKVLSGEPVTVSISVDDIPVGEPAPMFSTPYAMVSHSLNGGSVVASDINIDVDGVPKPIVDSDGNLACNR